jgi:hypothetical protein
MACSYCGIFNSVSVAPLYRDTFSLSGQHVEINQIHLRVCTFVWISLREITNSILFRVPYEAKPTRLFQGRCRARENVAGSSLERDFLVDIVSISYIG